MHPDDTMETLDTSVDTAALGDATDLEDALDTEQIPAIDPEELDLTGQTLITSAVRWEAAWS